MFWPRALESRTRVEYLGDELVEVFHEWGVGYLQWHFLEYVNIFYI